MLKQAVSAILTLAPSMRRHVARKKQEAGLYHHGSQLSRGPAGTRLIFPQKNSPSAGDWLVPRRDAGQNDVLYDAVAMRRR